MSSTPYARRLAELAAAGARPGPMTRLAVLSGLAMQRGLVSQDEAGRLAADLLGTIAGSARAELLTDLFDHARVLDDEERARRRSNP